MHKISEECSLDKIEREEEGIFVRVCIQTFPKVAETTKTYLNSDIYRKLKQLRPIKTVLNNHTYKSISNYAINFSNQYKLFKLSKQFLKNHSIHII